MSDQLEALEALLDDLPDAASRRRLGDRLNQSMETLRTADHQIGRIEAIVELADLIGMSGAGQGRLIEQLREEALEVGEWLEVADSDDELRDAVLEYEKVLLRSIANCEHAVRNQWRNSAAQQFRPLVALGELLQRINVEPELGQKLAETGRRALSAEHLGNAQALCTEVRTLIREQQALQEERASRISEGETGQFINALAEHKATLDMVTDEVRAWLEDNRALDRFTVAPRSPGSAAASAG